MAVATVNRCFWNTVSDNWAYTELESRKQAD